MSFSSEQDVDTDCPDKDMYTKISDIFEEYRSLFQPEPPVKYQKQDEPSDPNPSKTAYLEGLELTKVHHSVLKNREVIGWFFYEIATSPFPGSLLVCFLAPYLSLAAQISEIGDEEESSAGSIRIKLGQSPTISTESFFFYCLSAAVILQWLSYVFFGAYADYGSLKKPLLFLSSTVAALTVSLFFFISPDYFWIGGVLLLVSSTFYGVSLVYYNSYIPYLIKENKFYSDIYSNIASSTTNEVKEEGIISTSKTYSQKSIMFKHRKNEAIGASISLYSSMGGFISAVIVLIAQIVIFFVLPEACRPLCSKCPLNCESELCPADWDPDKCDPHGWAFRINLGIVGIWWLLFSVVSFLLLKGRRGNLLPRDTCCTLGFVNYIDNVRQVKKLPETFRFIIAFWITSDGMSTLAYSIWFLGSHSLAISTYMIGVAFLLSMVVSLLGNYVFLYLSNHYKFWKPTRVIIVCVCIAGILALWGFVMQSWYEFFISAILFGFIYGPVQAFSRALLASLIPNGKEAQFYSIYGFSEKSSNWLGPLLVACVTDATEDFRIAIVAIVILLGIGVGLIMAVDTQKGQRDAKAFTDNPSTTTTSCT